MTLEMQTQTTSNRSYWNDCLREMQREFGIDELSNETQSTHPFIDGWCECILAKVAAEFGVQFEKINTRTIDDPFRSDWTYSINQVTLQLRYKASDPFRCSQQEVDIYALNEMADVTASIRRAVAELVEQAAMHREHG